MLNMNLQFFAHKKGVGSTKNGLQRYVTADQRTDETDLGTNTCPQRASCFKVDDG